jgi:hypothetical protein
MEDPAPYAATPAADMSPQVGELAAALAKAQAAMKPAQKDAKNPHFGSRYSSLAEVWDAIREPLTANGLSVVQLPSSTPSSVSVATTLLHTSGQWMRSSFTMLLRPEYSKNGTELKPGPQQVGSAITYGRRYGLCAMVGVASTDEDDDGNAASRAGDPPPSAAKAEPAAPSQERLRRPRAGPGREPAAQGRDKTWPGG